MEGKNKTKNNPKYIQNFVSILRILRKIYKDPNSKNQLNLYHLLGQSNDQSGALSPTLYSLVEAPGNPFSH